MSESEDNPGRPNQNSPKSAWAEPHRLTLPEALGQAELAAETAHLHSRTPAPAVEYAEIKDRIFTISENVRTLG